jgi:alcohol dehydrogenase
MLMASYLAGIAICVAGVGAVHALAHTVGGIHGIGHGTANSLLLPVVMEFNETSCRDKLGNAASLLEGGENAATAVRGLTERLGLPQRLGDLGVQEADIDRIAGRCMETQGRIIANNPREFGLKDAASLLKKSL